MSGPVVIGAVDPFDPFGGAFQDALLTQYTTRLRPKVVTVLPTQAGLGDEVYFAADAANGVYWHLAYIPDGSAYPWKYVGGPPLHSEVLANENTASATYVALATAGPTAVLPLAGDYDVHLGFTLNNANASVAAMSYDIGGTGAVDNDSVMSYNSVPAGNYIASSRTMRKTGLPAATLTAKYKSVNSLSVFFLVRHMRVTPVRVG